MRDSGKASKSAINGIIKMLGDYTEIVQTELNNILKETEALSDIWQDNQYSQFLSHVESMKSSVEGKLHEISNARSELEKKVGIM